MANRTPNPKATGWVLGTVVIALGLSAGAYFLAIAPVMEETDAAREQTVATQAANDVLAIRIERLKGQFEHLDEYKAELAGLRSQVPSEAQMAAYFRELQALADAAGVVVTALDTTLGQTYVPPVPVAAAVPATEPATPAEGSGTTSAEGAATTDASTGAVTAAEAEAGVPAGFVVIPVGVTAVGAYDNVVSFLNLLQTGTQRLYLVTGFTATAQPEAEASGGRPATVPGDVEVAVTGFTYVLQDPAVAAVPVDPAAAPAPAPVLPAAVPGKNPVIPAGG